MTNNNPNAGLWELGMPIGLKEASRVLEVVDAGLSSGLGKQTPGEMCVEAAVCYALGLSNGDDPKCVSRAVRSFNIRLSDSSWSSNKARAFGMRSLSIAQLGSNIIYDGEFTRQLSIATIKYLIPKMIRKICSNHKFINEASILTCAFECENSSELGDAVEAARTAADSLAYAAGYAVDAVDAAAKAASANASANASAAAKAATYAAEAAADDSDDATYAAEATTYATVDATYAAAHAADAAAVTATNTINTTFTAYAACNASNVARDEFLSLSAQIAVGVLRKMNAPGIALMDALMPNSS